MQVRTLAVVAVLLVASSVAHAKSGVQWSPDGKRLFASKDVNGERWAITYNIDDGSTAGNVFFPDGRDPVFVWCQRLSDNGAADLFALEVNFRCFGAPRVDEGPFSIEDWTFIADVALPLNFYLPLPATCDFGQASNGPNANLADSFWECGTFQFQVFDHGGGVSSSLGPFTVAQTGCATATIDAGGDQAIVTLLISESGDLLNFYQRGLGTDAAFECRRVDLSGGGTSPF